MALIAIFCDGTWNSPKARSVTHVERLGTVCVNTDEQKVLYFSGVGTGKGMISDLGRLIDRLGGGIFGWGLNRNIKCAYLELCRVYQPGDKIMIFGFSRGAYTARSLVGLIRKCGILEQPTTDTLKAAFRLYRERGGENAPDTPRSIEARRILSPRFATSQVDVMTRGDDSFLVRISYLGVWDTVGALGIPSSLLGPVASLWNKRYAFHDTNLSSLVENARHAVALDEKRVFYRPTLWNNLSDTDAGPGLNSGCKTDVRPYQQIWFAGVHGTVGGSVENQELAGAALSWVWEEAARLGLTLKEGHSIPAELIDPTQQAPELGRYNPVYKLTPWLLKWRKGPRVSRNLHESVRRRLNARQDYRPGSLLHLLS